MSESIDFQPYLHAIRQEYGRWWEVYTVTDAEGRERRNAIEKPASPFDFGLMVQTVTPNPKPQTPNPKTLEEPKEKIERLPVLEGLRKYAFDEETRQLLLVGRPGSGKSTALGRLLLEEATLTASSAANLTLTLNPSPNIGRGELKLIPVLVELRYWQTSIVALMLDFFRRHGLNLSEAELEKLLDAKRVLVLMDGVNELPSEEARSQLATFRRQYPRVPAIFTTRDLSLGGDVGIEKKLEMQPLTEVQMQEFVRAYLPECGEAMWRQLQGRVREFGETPLLLWMLCEVVCQSPNAQLPSNLGGIFQVFTRYYEESSVRKHEVAALKGDVRPLSDRRLWCKALKHLAWMMMCAEKPVDLRVVIKRSEAERELEKLFEKEPFPPKTARDCLDDLLKYHLLQIKTRDEIEFVHQLIQEYYAAEALLVQLPQLSDGELKREYLNYLKWTEPVALMLALVEEEAQAVRMVRLALEVDGMLGARLAREVKREWQEQTVGMVSGLDVPWWLKFELWGKTRSDFAVPGLLGALEDENSHVRRSAVEALGNLGSEAAIPGLLQALEDEDFDVRWGAVEASKKLGSKAVISTLLQTLEDEDFNENWDCVEALMYLDSQSAVPVLIEALEDEYCFSYVRERAAEALGQLGSREAIPSLLRALEGEDPDVRGKAAEALEKFGDREVPSVLKTFDCEATDMYGKEAGELKNVRSQVLMPNLSQTFDNQNSYVRDRMEEELETLDSGAMMPSLLQLLEDKVFSIRRKAVAELGKLGSEAAISALLQALEDRNFCVREKAVEVLGNSKNDRAADILPNLLTLIPTESGEEALQALTAIQANCKFYNYDIFRSPPLPKLETEPPPGQTTNIYNIDTLIATHSPVNLGGTICGNQTCTQNPTPEP